MAFFLKYVDLYLTSEWGRFHVEYSVKVSDDGVCCTVKKIPDCVHRLIKIKGMLTYQQLPSFLKNCSYGICANTFLLSLGCHGYLLLVGGGGVLLGPIGSCILSSLFILFFGVLCFL
jgi:hypothetical protein